MLDLQQLRQEIAERGYDWEVKETPLQLIISERGSSALLGVKVDPELAAAQTTLARAIPAPAYAALPEPPASIDWRNVGGKNFVTPARSQGGCGSCVAFATVAAIESRLAIQEKSPNPKIDLSEAHLYFCAGRTCEQGWWPEKALNFARANGIGKESSFPYQDIDCSCTVPPPSPVATVTGWDTPQRSKHRKQAIAFNGPVVAVMKVYGDFVNYGGGVYRRVDDDYIGLHSVAVVGYDDAQKAWIIKNSWGAGWGKSGFGLIGYGECDIDSQYVFWDPYVSRHAPALANALSLLDR